MSNEIITNEQVANSDDLKIKFWDEMLKFQIQEGLCPSKRFAEM